MLTVTTPNTAVTAAYASSASPSGASAGVSFSKVLANNTPADLANHAFRSGQVSVDMHTDGQRINSVSYYDASGQKLTTSPFLPQDILRNCEKFNIPLSDLQGIGPQLDAAGVAYRPYQQYAGTGSNHGIDLDNLAAGGMGTAYDWTQDPLVHLKGLQALAQLQADKALAQRLGIVQTGPSNSSAVATVAAATPVSSTAKPATTTPTQDPLDVLMALLQQIKTGTGNSSSATATEPAASVAAAPTAAASAPAATPVTPSTGVSQRPNATNNSVQQLQQMQRLLETLLASSR